MFGLEEGGNVREGEEKKGETGCYVKSKRLIKIL